LNRIEILPGFCEDIDIGEDRRYESPIEALACRDLFAICIRERNELDKDRG